MMLCHSEVKYLPQTWISEAIKLLQAVSGNREGSIFYHLRASRHLIVKLIKSTTGGECKNTKDLRGFTLEIYAYLTLVANITPYSKVLGWLCRDPDSMPTVRSGFTLS